MKLNPRVVSHSMVALVAITLTHFAPRVVHPEKHTGALTMRFENHAEQKQYWERPNHDIICMEWDGTEPEFHITQDANKQVVFPQVKDITYTDVNANVRHFIKASL